MRRTIFQETLDYFDTLPIKNFEQEPLVLSLREESKQALSNARPFIISRDVVASALSESVPNPPFDLPLPFESVWIEPLVGDHGDLVSMMKLYPPHVNDSFELVAVHVFKLSQDTISYDLILAKQEEKTASFEMWSVTTTKEGFQNNKFLIELHGFVFGLFNKLHQRFSLGLEKTNIRTRVGRGLNRRQVFIKNLIHVVHKSERKKIAANSVTIDWSHRWEVMGHWRKIRGIGKDCTNNYNVVGFTWVRPYEKGPEHENFVKKSRILDPSSTGQNPAL